MIDVEKLYQDCCRKKKNRRVRILKIWYAGKLPLCKTINWAMNIAVISRLSKMLGCPIPHLTKGNYKIIEHWNYYLSAVLMQQISSEEPKPFLRVKAGC